MIHYTTSESKKCFGTSRRGDVLFKFNENVLFSGSEDCRLSQTGLDYRELSLRLVVLQYGIGYHNLLSLMCDILIVIQFRIFVSLGDQLASLIYFKYPPIIFSTGKGLQFYKHDHGLLSDVG